ncbi:MAG: ABC transporter permease [Candidatus Solibacter sp.]|jgi:putative ABC transport system permease protein
MHFFGQDLRYGLRRLGKTPAFTVVALLTLALGMGANTGMFSVVDTVLLKPLPFRDAENLLVIWEKNPSQNRYRMFVAPANFLAWRNEGRAVERMAAVQEARLNLTGGPNGHIDPEELKVERVTAGLFPMLGVEPELGRAFRSDEDQPGRANVVLLSHALWQRRFAGDPGITGKTIRLRDQPYTVVGVLPPAFAVMEAGVDLFVPLGLNPSDTRSANARVLTVIARRRGPLRQVRAELDAVGARMEQALPALDRGCRPSVFELNDELVGGARRPLWVLMAAVALLLLMACVNVANLLLARGATRRKEIALRTALGAGRGRIVTQLLSESVLLALGGGGLGLLLAACAVYVLAHAGPASVPRLAQAALDLRVFGFALAVSLATGILFGLAPAMQVSGSSLNMALVEGGRGGTAGRTGRRIRNVLAITEVALAVVVLIGAGLLIRSFIRLRAVDPGFQPARMLTVRVPLAGGRNAAGERRIAFFKLVTDRIATLPGVRAVGAVNVLPLTGLGVGATFAVEGRPAPSAEQRPMGLMRSVTPAYFGAMGIPLLAGRALADSDTALSPPVIVVNQTLARRFWPGASAIGGRLAIDQLAGRVAEIVGVVGDVKPDRMEGGEWPTLYHSYPQAPAAAMTLVVRTAGAPLRLASAVESEVRRLDPDQPVADVRTMEDVVNLAVAGARFQTALLASFAGVAFLLAAVGIYGVISYDVSQRTNEIGIRMALGAQPSDVRRLILGQGARLAVYGIVAGLLGAAVLTRWMGTMLFGVGPTDVWTYAAVSTLLAVVALGASYIPSRRAMVPDPVIALRHE